MAKTAPHWSPVIVSGPLFHWLQKDAVQEGFPGEAVQRDQTTIVLIPQYV